MCIGLGHIFTCQQGTCPVFALHGTHKFYPARLIFRHANSCAATELLLADL
jgi:hypothetical protein